MGTKSTFISLSFACHRAWHSVDTYLYPNLGVEILGHHFFSYRMPSLPLDYERDSQTCVHLKAHENRPLGPIPETSD